MKLISMRIPAAAVGGATLMAWRAYAISPSGSPPSTVEVEMSDWVILGISLLFLMLLWELVRAYLRLNERYDSPVDPRA